MRKNYTPSEHLALIRTYCTVLAEKPGAIWFEDGSFRYAEVWDPSEGWISYSCDTQEEWELLTEQFPTLKKKLKKVLTIQKENVTIIV